jgi:predicted RNA binding protein YcfA (HicA-like mRNA interferase family)
MPKLKQLSGDDVIKIFISFGFEVISQRGSHIKLRRISDLGEKQTLTVPNHKELDKGTLKAIIRWSGKYLSDNEIAVSFYHR